MKTLKVGAKGSDVIKLQLLLNNSFGSETKIKNDGHFGKKTLELVKVFQKKKGLINDGIVGSKTWSALSGNTNITISVQSTKELVIDAPWYNAAVAEKGVKELIGENKHTQRILTYHATTTLSAKKDETPWCSSFVNWVMKQAGHRGTNSAAAKSWLNWGLHIKEANRKEGDVVVIKRINKNSDASTGSSSGYHVGFYVQANKAKITIFGGNQGNAVKNLIFGCVLTRFVATDVPYQKPLRFQWSEIKATTKWHYYNFLIDCHVYMQTVKICDNSIDELLIYAD